MRYYKVYAKNCVVSRRIKELSEQEVDTIICEQTLREEYSDEFDFEYDMNGDIKDSSWNIYYDKITKSLHQCLDEIGFIDCGDYRVVKVECIGDVEVPNCCASTMII